MKRSVFTYDPKNNRKILAGWIDEDKAIFFKEVTKSKHLLRVANAYAIQKDVFDKLKDEVAYVVILEKDTGMAYQASMEYWKTMGRDWEHGHGKQRILSVTYMYEFDKKKLDE